LLTFFFFFFFFFFFHLRDGCSFGFLYASAVFALVTFSRILPQTFYNSQTSSELFNNLGQLFRNETKQVVSAVVAFCSSILHLPVLLGVRRINLYRADMVDARNAGRRSNFGRAFCNFINRMDPGVIANKDASAQSYRRDFGLSRLSNAGSSKRREALVGLSPREQFEEIRRRKMQERCGVDSLHLVEPNIEHVLSRGHPRTIYVQFFVGFFICLAVLLLVKFGPTQSPQFLGVDPLGSVATFNKTDLTSWNGCQVDGFFRANATFGQCIKGGGEFFFFSFFFAP
jgi:hypothetical protein